MISRIRLVSALVALLLAITALLWVSWVVADGDIPTFTAFSTFAIGLIAGFFVFLGRALFGAHPHEILRRIIRRKSYTHYIDVLLYGYSGSGKTAFKRHLKGQDQTPLAPTAIEESVEVTRDADEFLPKAVITFYDYPGEEPDTIRDIIGSRTQAYDAIIVLVDLFPVRTPKGSDIPFSDDDLVNQLLRETSEGNLTVEHIVRNRAQEQSILYQGFYQMILRRAFSPTQTKAVHILINKIDLLDHPEIKISLEPDIRDKSKYAEKVYESFAEELQEKLVDMGWARRVSVTPVSAVRGDGIASVITSIRRACHGEYGNESTQ